jgi:hypothetical protein
MKIMKKRQTKTLLGQLLLFCGLFLGIISTQAQTTPGGVNNANYEWAAWLTPDSYISGTWENLIPATSVGNFITQADKPAKVNSGYNFHPSVKFVTSAMYTAPNRMTSAGDFSLTSNYGFTTFMVAINNAKYGTYGGTILGFFTGATSSYSNRTYFWNTTNKGRLQSYWTDSNRNLGNMNSGLITIDNLNQNSSHIYSYNNGQLIASAITGSAGAATFSNKMYLGWCGTTTYDHGWDGTIQELIIVKNTAGGVMSATDMRKIHSYLAVKYGITLNNTDNYTLSGTEVWTYDATYKYNIFGIGRDDDSGLYQKQSHSTTDENFTVFVGDNIAPLNNQNSTGSLDNKQFLMLGANNADFIQPRAIAAGTGYENDVLAVDCNAGSAIYKAQLSAPAIGDPFITVNLALNKQLLSNYKYVLVSTSANFDSGGAPGTTKIYPLIDGVAEGIKLGIVGGYDYKYITFIGIATGPGGVTTNLIMWLRADEKDAITTEDLNKSNARLASYPDPTNEATLPVVLEWKDRVRGIEYTYASGQDVDKHRYPVYKSNSPEMNYHSAVRFWSNSTSYAAYLSKVTGLLTTDNPIGGKHTAYFLVNNDFGSKKWFYTMGFRDDNNPSQGFSYSGIPRPAYGAEKRDDDSKIVGRFRSSSTELRGSEDMFNIGATTMLGYKTSTNNSGTNNKVLFRFNGKEENKGDFNWNHIDFTKSSWLGTGYDEDRTINGVMSEVLFFENALTENETDLVESYLAIKYGITLRPDDVNPHRINYKFSTNTPGNTSFWPGFDAVGTDKYAIFYNNIAAVIRDDAAMLHNTHSHSTDQGSILHLGVAGKLLGNTNVDVGDLEYDKEAIVWGNDAATGITLVSAADCGDFEYIFNRKWFIHKQTHGDRAINMLVGAQDNRLFTFGGKNVTGNSAAIANNLLYEKLTAGYDVYMVVASSLDDFDNKTYKAVVPMTYINGEHQCNYTFSEEDTYITFGYKANNKGCLGEISFSGYKTFNWSQWKSSTNPNSTTSPTITIDDDVDLGDGIIVTKTSVAYPAGTRTGRGYPRGSSTPENGSLEVRRERGNLDDPVIITIEFNAPIRPEFTISGIGGRSRAYEKVEITGECSGNTYLPSLSYASHPTLASYSIRGNVAEATKNQWVRGNDRNGRLNVTFDGGVTKITIKYSVTNRMMNVYKQIFISPIIVRPVPPPPPINEDGFSFTKEVKKTDITTCEPAEYSFYITNNNCDPKYVTFTDTIPDGLKMTWEFDSFVLDTINALYNPSVIINDYAGGKGLRVDSLLIPGVSTIKLQANALLDEDAPDGMYDNQAKIEYELIKMGTPNHGELLSVDRYTLDPYTSFYATHTDRQLEVTMDITAVPKTYLADREIELTYTIVNPNGQITDMFMDIDFNEYFTYVAGSFSINSVPATTPTAFCVLPPVEVPPIPIPSLTIAGTTDGITGFILPTDTTIIKVKLKAPDKANLEKDLLTGKNVDLEVIHSVVTEMEDPCVILSLKKLTGSKRIPYMEITHIITNKNTTTKMEK